MKIQLRLVDAKNYAPFGVIELQNTDSHLIPVAEDMVNYEDAWWKVSRRRFTYLPEMVVVHLECYVGHPLETPKQTKERHAEKFGDAEIETGPDAWMK